MRERQGDMRQIFGYGEQCDLYCRGAWGKSMERYVREGVGMCECQGPDIRMRDSLHTSHLIMLTIIGLH